MALSPKERENIIEEERLRYETRQSLHAEHCAKHPRRGRWLWWAAVLLLAYAVYSHFACGRAFCPWGGPACHHGMGAMGMGGYPACRHGMMPGMMPGPGMMAPDEAPEAPAAKPAAPAPKPAAPKKP